MVTRAEERDIKKLNNWISLYENTRFLIPTKKQYKALLRLCTISGIKDLTHADYFPYNNKRLYYIKNKILYQDECIISAPNYLNFYKEIDEDNLSVIDKYKNKLLTI